MSSRSHYEEELKTVKERIIDISNKIYLNDMWVKRVENSGGFYIDRGLFWEGELARLRDRRLELLYILREKK